MNRKLKVLGLALIAVFAMSAVAASGAQAQLKLTTTGPTWLTFDRIPGTEQEFESRVAGVKVLCENVTGHATVVNNQTEVTATNIAYSGNCRTSIAGSEVTVTMNGCDYLFHGGKTDPNNAEHGIEGEVDLVCPAGKSIVIDVYASAAKHTAGETLCKLNVSDRSPIKRKSHTQIHRERRTILT